MAYLIPYINVLELFISLEKKAEFFKKKAEEAEN